MDCSSLPERPLKRRARFAPQLLADGLTSGIVSDQGNLVHGAFDAEDATSVDPYVNIHSDKFELLASQMTPVSVDPSQVASTNISD